MGELIPLIVIVCGIVFCFLLSIYVIAKEENKGKKRVLNLTQIIIFIGIWKYASIIFVKKLQILPNDNYVFIAVLLLILVTGMINNRSWKQPV